MIVPGIGKTFLHCVLRNTWADLLWCTQLAEGVQAAYGPSNVTGLIVSVLLTSDLNSTFSGLEMKCLGNVN